MPESTYCSSEAIAETYPLAGLSLVTVNLHVFCAFSKEVGSAVHSIQVLRLKKRGGKKTALCRVTPILSLMCNNSFNIITYIYIYIYIYIWHNEFILHTHPTHVCFTVCRARSH